MVIRSQKHLYLLYCPVCICVQHSFVPDVACLRPQRYLGTRTRAEGFLAPTPAYRIEQLSSLLLAFFPLEVLIPSGMNQDLGIL